MKSGCLKRVSPAVAVMVGLAAAARTGPALAEQTPALWTPDAISTNGYESSPAFTSDGREMFYVAADRHFRAWRIMRATCDANGWSGPEPAPFSAALPTIEADPAITPDGQWIYFVSARHDTANEDFDIYRANRLGDGAWSEPERLPEPVNSPDAELLPRIDGSGRLFFGSARPGGFGQSDIYMAVEAAPGAWIVNNVGPPVSTDANEYEAEVSRDGRTLIVVADRGDRSHLYRFEQKPEGGWMDKGRLPGRSDVFQVGPLLSPKSEWLLFSQSHGALSGEIFLLPLVEKPSEKWPPSCGAG